MIVIVILNIIIPCLQFEKEPKIILNIITSTRECTASKGSL